MLFQAVHCRLVDVAYTYKIVPCLFNLLDRLSVLDK